MARIKHTVDGRAKGRTTFFSFFRSARKRFSPAGSIDRTLLKQRPQLFRRDGDELSRTLELQMAREDVAQRLWTLDRCLVRQLDLAIPAQEHWIICHWMGSGAVSIICGYR
jgi:hypothetical protein